MNKNPETLDVEERLKKCPKDSPPWWKDYILMYINYLYSPTTPYRPQWSNEPTEQRCTQP